MLVVLLAAFVVFVVASARLFVWPPADSPAPANAVVALGGDTGQRRAVAAIRIAETWHIPNVVVSLGGAPVRCPSAPARISVTCFRPDPVNTRGEAEYVARLVGRRHWRRIIVVPQRTQTTRARLLFERCTDTQMLWVPVSDPPTHLPFDVAYEWGALLKALVLQRSC